MWLPVVMQYYIFRQNLVLNLLPKAHIPPALSALASVSDGRLPPAIIASAAMKQAFAECIIKSQYLFRADITCPYGAQIPKGCLIPPYPAENDIKPETKTAVVCDMHLQKCLTFVVHISV